MWWVRYGEGRILKEGTDALDRYDEILNRPGMSTPDEMRAMLEELQRSLMAFERFEKESWLMRFRFVARTVRIKIAQVKHTMQVTRDELETPTLRR